MIEVVIENCRVLRKLMDCIKKLVVNGYLEFSSNGLQIQASDMENLSMACVYLNTSFFVKYFCETNMTICINVAQLWLICGWIGEDIPITIRAKSQVGSVDVITGDSSGSFSIYQIQSIVLEGNIFDVGDIQYDAIIIMDSKRFEKICCDLTIGFYEMVIQCDGTSINFVCIGDVMKVHVKLVVNDSTNNYERISIQFKQFVKQRVQTRFLRDHSQSAPLSKNVIIKMSNSSPFYIEYKLEPDITNEENHIGFYITPTD